MQYTEKNFDERSRLKRESLFHLANGRLGVRGAFEEGTPSSVLSIRGTYLNGFCENEPISYNERLAGFTDGKQQIVNLPDAQTIRILAGKQLLSCFDGTELVQTLDMQNGVYERSFTVDTEKGRIALRFTRLVSFTEPEIFAVECLLESRGFEGELRIESCLNPDVRNFTASNDPRVASGDGRMLQTVCSSISGDVMSVIAETRKSHRRVACASMHHFDDENNHGKITFTKNESTGELTAVKTLFLPKDGSVSFRKYTIYREVPASVDTSEDSEFTSLVTALRETAGNGFPALCKAQREYLDRFWQNARVTVDGNDELQVQLDFCLFGMLSSAGKDGKTNVAAKGLSGEGYEGHYFWDSEIYIFPFFLMTEPNIARSLLEYRYLHLPDAHRHARTLGHSCGALYPWRTITGSECSSHYPSGSAQYHINGDIAHAFISYWQVTHDESFLENTCELLVETARLWLDAGHWYNGEFRIDCVTGPDEYTCLVNNNYYTNSCAAENLIYAERLCRELEKRGGFSALREKLSITEEELKVFRTAGEGMYFPHDDELKIIAQDDSFLHKKRWDLASIPKENYPLLMHYHPMIINRYQVLKQADSVLANHIYREEDILTMKRSFAYYEEITTHDSSLSNCIYAIMAARLGDMQRASFYFNRCVGTDTSDQNGNTRDGLHIANMGGVYRVMTCGFGGVKIGDGHNGASGLSLFPMLPPDIAGISFPLYYQGRRLSVSVKPNECTLTLTEGDPLTLECYGQEVTIGVTGVQSSSAQNASGKTVSIKRLVKGVVFDLDGVVTDTAVYHFQAWKRLADELGIPFDEERNECFKGVSRAQCLRLLLGWGGMTVTEEEFAELLDRKNRMYGELLDELTPSSILPGIPECLAMLKDNGIPAALFSVSKNTDRILERLSMSNAFDAKVTGNDIHYSKPHFEGYLLAAQRIGVDPRLCVMVEDSSAGIEGAKLVSMRTLAIMKDNVSGADACVSSTADVLPALKDML
ncbi:MAG: beta-phosphoglucomutase [Eubacteriales bacterium]|nr:beta-phosphoglucomutase [Eubacteriales bacterium]